MQIVPIFTVISIPLCFLLFLKGFFPLRTSSNGFSTKKFIPSLDPISTTTTIPLSVSSLDANSISNSQELDQDNGRTSTGTTQTYQRMVLMVIDALRDDFLKPEFNYLPNTIKRLRRGHGLVFTAQTHPPTVTLPRIKAITTGTIPGFIDVVLNFGSTALTEDNIVTQMKINKKKIIFYGDDTWINLFPEHFATFDGTTSFIVTDFTEVDANVSRHLPSQLQSDVDWDVMILHYLGLDHIGHVSGPKSPLVRPKLAEMDEVINKVYSAMEKWESESGISSILVICGDHGMSDQGGHGGSSPSEILVPLVFLSPSISSIDFMNRGLVSQTDLCPTLAVLLGLPVPSNSLGKIITDTLVGYSLPQKVSVVFQNAQHVLSVFKNFVKDVKRESAYILYASAFDEYKKWFQVNKDSIGHQEWERAGHRLLDLFSESLSLMAERVSKLSCQYDVYAMATSILLLWLVLFSILMTLLKRDMTLPEPSVSKYLSQVVSIIGSAFMSHIVMCTGGLPSALMCGSSPFNIGVQLFVAGVLICCILHLVLGYGRLASWKQQIKHLIRGKAAIEWFMIFATICHTFTLLSSSFVEEEHQTFYFLTISIHILLIAYVGFMFVKSQYVLHEEGSSFEQFKHRLSPNNTLEDYDLKGKSEGDCIDDDAGNKTTYDADNVQIESTEKYDISVQDSQLPHQGSLTNEMEDFKEIRCSDGKHDTTSIKRGSIGLADTETEDADYIHIISPKEALHVCVSVVTILVFLRVLRRWNQTGNKWLNEPDLGDWLVNPDNKPTLSLVVLLSLVIIGASRSLCLPRLHAMCVNLSLVCTYMSRAASKALIFPDTRFISTSGVAEARASYIFLGLTVFLSMLPLSLTQEDDNKNVHKKIKATSNFKALKGGKNLTRSAGNSLAKSKVNQRESVNSTSTPQAKRSEGKNLKDLFSVKSDLYSSLLDINQDRRVHILNGVTAAWLCLMCLVLRPHNVPVVALMSLIEQMAVYAIIKTGIRPLSVLLYCLWMGHAFFFFQGNSNSISTVDVSAGYVGVTEYNPVIIGLLMALATYSGLIFWLLSFLRVMCLTYSGSDGSKRLKLVLQNSLTWLSLKMLFPLAIYSVVVSTQRYHLFVWTVFSPKLLYQAMETAVLTGMAIVIYCMQMLVD